MEKYSIKSLHSLLSHLRNCPDVFLRVPLKFDPDGLHTLALVTDRFREISGDFFLNRMYMPDESDLGKLGQAPLIPIQIACWLFAHPEFRDQERKQQVLWGMKTFMLDQLPQLSLHVKTQEWLHDEDRNEEFVRLALMCCDFLPDGESEAEASDRLDALSTIKRFKVLRDSTDAFERTMEIRRKMAEQKAREAANTYGRE